MKFIFSLFAEPKIKTPFKSGFGVLFGVLFFFAVIANYAAAETMYYVDDKGVVHFVEDMSLIPAKYKGQKGAVGNGAKEDAPIEKKTPGVPVLGTKTEKPEIKDKFGNSPSYWRQRYKGLLNEKAVKERELREMESQRDELARKYDSVRSRAYFVGDSQSVTEAATTELKVRELENMIKITISQIDAINRKISIDIYDELMQAGGSSDWLLRDE